MNRVEQLFTIYLNAAEGDPPAEDSVRAIMAEMTEEEKTKYLEMIAFHQLTKRN